MGLRVAVGGADESNVWHDANVASVAHEQDASTKVRRGRNWQERTIALLGAPKDMAMANREALLTVAEVAAELRVSTMTVYRLIQAAELSAFRIGKNYRIKRDDLDAYLAAGAVRADETNG